MPNWPPSSSCVMPSTVTGTTPYHHNDLKRLFMHDPLGCLDEARPTLPFANQLDEFLIHLQDDRGLSQATTIHRKRTLEPFFSWLIARGGAIATVTPRDISDFFQPAERTDGHRKPFPAASILSGLSSAMPLLVLGVRLISQRPSTNPACIPMKVFPRGPPGKMFSA